MSQKGTYGTLGQLSDICATIVNAQPMAMGTQDVYLAVNKFLAVASYSSIQRALELAATRQEIRWEVSNGGKWLWWSDEWTLKKI